MWIRVRGSVYVLGLVARVSSSCTVRVRVRVRVGLKVRVRVRFAR